MKSKSTRSGLVNLTIIYAVGNFGSKALSFILVFVLTYFLTREEIGSFDLIFTALTLVIPVITLSIDFSLFRWVAGSSSEVEISKIFQNVFGILFVCSLFYCLLYWLIINHIGIDKNLYFPIFLYGFFMIFYPSLLQGTRGIERSRLYVLAGILFSIINVSVTICLLYFTDLRINGVLLANAASYALVSAFLVYKNGWIKYIRTASISKGLSFDFLKYSLPLIPNTLSWWLINYAVRFVILYYLGQDQNGVFSISNKYPAILLIFTDVFSLAWQEKLIKMNGEAGEYFSSTLEKYTKVILSLILVLSVLSSTLMHLVEPSFYEAWQYIPILLYGVALQAFSGFLGAAFLAFKETKILLISSIIGGVISILSSFYLVQFGLQGISVAIVLGFGILFIVRWTYIKNLIMVKFPLRWFFVLSGLYVITSSLLYLEDSIVTFLLIGLSIGIGLWVNRENISSKFIKKKI